MRYLQLEKGESIDKKSIIGIFDIENSSVSKDTRDFLRNAEKLKRVVYTTYELPKSFVVCLDESLNETVYVSQLSCATLRKRFLKKEIL